MEDDTRLGTSLKRSTLLPGNATLQIATTTTPGNGTFRSNRKEFNWLHSILGIKGIVSEKAFDSPLPGRSAFERYLMEALSRGQAPPDVGQDDQEEEEPPEDDGGDYDESGEDSDEENMRSSLAMKALVRSSLETPARSSAPRKFNAVNLPVAAASQAAAGGRGGSIGGARSSGGGGSLTSQPSLFYADAYKPGGGSSGGSQARSFPDGTCVYDPARGYSIAGALEVEPSQPLDLASVPSTAIFSAPPALFAQHMPSVIHATGNAAVQALTAAADVDKGFEIKWPRESALATAAGKPPLARERDRAAREALVTPLSDKQTFRRAAPVKIRVSASGARQDQHCQHHGRSTWEGGSLQDDGSSFLPSIHSRPSVVPPLPLAQALVAQQSGAPGSKRPVSAGLNNPGPTALPLQAVPNITPSARARTASRALLVAQETAHRQSVLQTACASMSPLKSRTGKPSLASFLVAADAAQDPSGVNHVVATLYGGDSGYQDGLSQFGGSRASFGGYSVATGYSLANLMAERSSSGGGGRLSQPGSNGGGGGGGRNASQGGVSATDSWGTRHNSLGGSAPSEGGAGAAGPRQSDAGCSPPGSAAAAAADQLEQHQASAAAHRSVSDAGGSDAALHALGPRASDSGASGIALGDAMAAAAAAAAMTEPGVGGALPPVTRPSDGGISMAHSTASSWVSLATSKGSTRSGRTFVLPLEDQRTLIEVEVAMRPANPEEVAPSHPLGEVGRLQRRYARHVSEGGAHHVFNLNRAVGSAKMVAALVDLLPSLPQVSRLLLGSNDLTDELLQLLAAVMQSRSVPGVRELDLNNNRLTALAVSLLGPLLNSQLLGGPGHLIHSCVVVPPHSYLTDLCLAGNNIGDAGLLMLVDALDESPLRRLDVSKCGITDKSAPQLAVLVASARGLRHLALNWNNLGLKGAKAIAGGLCTAQGVEELQLAWTGLSDRGSSFLARAMIQNASVRLLDLSGTSASMATCLVMADSLRRNRCLRRLLLRDNPLGSKGPMALLRATVGHATLDTLDMAGSSFAPVHDGVFGIKWDPREPNGKYRLDLTVPVERLIAVELLRMAAVQGLATWVNPRHAGKAVKVEALMAGYRPPEPPEPPAPPPDNGRRSARRQQQSKQPAPPPPPVKDPTPEPPKVYEVNEDAVPYDGRLLLTFASTKLLLREAVAVSEQEFDTFWTRQIRPREGLPPGPELHSSVSVDMSARKTPRNGVIRASSSSGGASASASSSDGGSGAAEASFADANNVAVAPPDDWKLSLVSALLTDCFFTSAMVARIVSDISSGAQKADAALRMFGRVVDPQNYQLVYDQLGPAQVEELRDRLGSLRLFTPDNPTGVWSLILSHPTHRAVAQRLLDMYIKQVEEKLSRWPARSCFQSCLLDGESLRVAQPRKFKLPDMGSLTLTFVDQRKPPPTAVPMAKEHFIVLLGLLAHEERLDPLRVVGALGGRGVKAAVRALMRWSAWSDKHPMGTSVLALRAASRAKQQPLTPQEAGGASNDADSTSGAIIASTSVASVPGGDNDASAGWRVRDLDGFVEVIRRLSIDHFFSCQQVLELVRLVPPEATAQRVELCNVLFNCVVEGRQTQWVQVMRALTSEQQVQVAQRLGITNVFNASSPSMHYQLRMWRQEEADVAMKLHKMALTTPYDCFVNFVIDGRERKLRQDGNFYNLMCGSCAEDATPQTVVEFDFVFKDLAKELKAAQQHQAAAAAGSGGGGGPLGLWGPWTCIFLWRNTYDVKRMLKSEWAPKEKK